MKFKGYTINYPPIFKRYKDKVLDFFGLCHMDMLDMMKNGNHIPLHENRHMIPKSYQTKEQKD